MAVIHMYLLAFTCLNVKFGYVLSDDDYKKIVWPETYHFKGEKFDIVSQLWQPFEIWHSPELNRSRVDWYGGENKMYLYGDKNRVYSVFPISKENLTSETFCGWRNFTIDDKMDFLPSTTDLNFTGTKIRILADKTIDVWAYKINTATAITENTLQVFRTEFDYDIPVQRVYKSAFRTSDEVYKVINYYNFNDSVANEDLTLENVDQCQLSNWGSFMKWNIPTHHSPMPSEVDIMFDSYTKQHNKVYHDNEILKRKLILENNWRIVEEHNRRNLSYRMELNSFSDRTPEELKYLSGALISEEPSRLALPFPHTLEEINKIAATLPTEFDLRMEGVISPVKYQASCGSCWAFAVTAAIEGVNGKNSSKRVWDLSEQSLIDCSWSFGNLGCDGGYLDKALFHVFTNGIADEVEYGYTAHDGTCKMLNVTSNGNIRGVGQVLPRTFEALKVAVHQYGPVAITTVTSDKIIKYSSGIYYEPQKCKGKGCVVHAMALVGFGVRDDQEYLLAKNSWGDTWGESGYILLSTRNNNCNLLQNAYYPIL